MAENKKSFILYVDNKPTFEELSDDEAGRLIKHIFRYVADENPQAPDRITKICFEQIKSQLKRDLVKYEEKRKKDSDNGILGNLKKWHIDLYNEVVNSKMTLNKALKIVEERKISPPDNNLSPPDENSRVQSGHIAVNASVIANVNVIDIINSIMEFFNFSEFKNADKQTQISTFVNIIIHQNLLENFNTNFEAYKKLKFSNPIFTHSFKNFIGTAKERYLDGAWNEENWEEKLKAHTSSNKTFEVKGATDQSNNANLFK